MYLDYQLKHAYRQSIVSVADYIATHYNESRDSVIKRMILDWRRDIRGKRYNAIKRLRTRKPIVKVGR